MNPTLKQLLEDIKTYIEQQELCNEHEYGSCSRSIDDLMKAGEMPEVYNRLLDQIERNK